MYSVVLFVVVGLFVVVFVFSFLLLDLKSKFVDSSKSACCFVLGLTEIVLFAYVGALLA